METKIDNSNITAVSVHPGRMVADWLDDVGIKQKDFAQVIGLPASRLNEFIKGKRDLDQNLAEKLSEHLGMSPEYWIRQQAQFEYNEKMLSLRAEEEIATEAQESSLMTIFNLKELYKHLKISSVSSLTRMQMLFEKIPVTYEEMNKRVSIVGCFKHSDTLNMNEKNLRTWILIAQIEAMLTKVKGRYSKDNGEIAATEIAAKANQGNIKESDIEEILSNNGIAYAVVPKLDGCPVDAYSVQVNGIPSIIVTHRHNDMQKLIFDVLHEIGHINMHIQGEYNGYINLEYSRLNPQEIEANEYAQDKLIPPTIWKEILKIQTTSIVHEVICRKLGNRAKEFGINPIIAVSRYKYESRNFKGKSYRHTHIE